MCQMSINNLKAENPKNNGYHYRYKRSAKVIVLVVLEQVLMEVGEDKIYTILVDECTDVTGN